MRGWKAFVLFSSNIENEMVGWRHGLNGRESEQPPEEWNLKIGVSKEIFRLHVPKTGINSFITSVQPACHCQHVREMENMGKDIIS